MCAQARLCVRPPVNQHDRLRPGCPLSWPVCISVFLLSPFQLAPLAFIFPSPSLALFSMMRRYWLCSGGGWVSLGGFLQSSLFHPGIKFPAYLNTPLCLLLLLHRALRRSCVNARCVSCMYVFQSVGASLPTYVSVSVKFINDRWLLHGCWNKIMNVCILISCL